MSHPTFPAGVAVGDLGHVQHHNDIHDFIAEVVLVLSGVIGSRPAAGDVDTGTLYWATDTSLLYRSDGATWDELTAGAANHGELGNITSDDHHAEDHAARHATAGDDPLAPGAIGAATSGHNHDADYEPAGAVGNHEAAADPHAGYQLESEKGSANGYASLDAGGEVPTDELGSGTADATTFLRGDQTWAAPGGGGDVVATSPASPATVAINSTSFVSIFSETITGVAAGDLVSVEFSFDILQGSGSTRAFEHVFDAGGMSLSATNVQQASHPSSRKSYIVRALMSVITAAASRAVIEMTTSGGSGATVDGVFTGAGTPIDRHGWTSVATDETGSMLIAFKIRSDSALSGQVLRFNGAVIRKVAL